MNSAIRALLIAVLVCAAVLSAFFLLREDETPAVGGGGSIGRDGSEEPEPQPAAPPVDRVTRGTNQRTPGTSNDGESPPAPDNDEGPEVVPLPQGKGRAVVEVVDNAGSPIESVKVLLRTGRASDSRDTDHEGKAAFEQLAAGRYSFRVSGEGIPELVAAKEIALGAGENKTVTLRVSDFGQTISGRVLDRDGNPVERIRVFGRKQMFEVQEGDFVQADQGNLQAESDAEGVYRLEGLEAADYLLRTEATETYPAVRKIFRAGVETADLVLDLTQEFEIFGVVTGGNGDPVENARVVPIGQASRQGRTDSDGRFSIFLALSDGKSAYALKVTSDDFKERQLHVFAAEIQQAENWELNVSLEPLEELAPVRGVVLDAENQPVVHETVTIYSAALTQRARATTDGRGAFDLGEVQVGDYRLWVYPRKAYKDFSLDPLTVTDSGLELKITLEPIATGSLSARLVDPNGGNIAGFRLWLRSRKALGNTMEITSDGEGYVELDDVPAGELIFETRSFPRLAVRGIQFDPDEDPSVVELVLDWGVASVVGVVLDKTGTPIGGANITLSWTANLGDGKSSSIRHTVADAAGRFTFSELAGVEHKVSATANGFRTAQATVFPGEGELKMQLESKQKPK